MRLLIRMLLIGFLSLFTGTIVNQVHPGGIPMNLLTVLSLQTAGSVQPEVMPVDEAFFLHMKDTVRFLDIRPQDDFQMDHIPGAVSVPFYRLFEDPDLFKGGSDTLPWIVYDFRPGSFRAKAAAGALIRRESGPVHVLEGGFSAWLEMEFPVSRENNR